MLWHYSMYAHVRNWCQFCLIHLLTDIWTSATDVFIKFMNYSCSNHFIRSLCLFLLIGTNFWETRTRPEKASFKIAVSYTSFFFNYLPSSGIASYVGNAETVMWCLHFMLSCCVALGLFLIWVVCTDWFEELISKHIHYYYTRLWE